MATFKSFAFLLITASLTCAAPLSVVAACVSPGSDDSPADLVVNGEVIPAIAVRREMVYRLGLRQLEARKLNIFLGNEIENRGLDAKNLVGDAEVEVVIESGRARMREEFEGQLTEEEILANNKLTLDGWRDQTRLALLFNRLFLPDDPDEWPEITKEALSQSVPEDQRDLFMEKMREGYLARKAQGLSNDPNDPQRLMFNMMLRGPIQLALEERSDVKTAKDGIPPEIAMIVDGVEIRTDDVFENLKRELAPIEWERTRVWLAKNTALRQALEAKGAFLDDEGFAEVWGTLQDKYKDSFIPLEQLAISFKRFPSISAYQTFLRGFESYRDLIADEINDESLTVHLDRANRLMGLEQVDAEVILLSAFDFRMSRWKENGWADAKQRAIDVSRLLAQGGNWDEILEEHSDYWDPPLAASQMGSPPQTNRRNRGRFGLKNRNSLLPMVDESDYQIFLNGSSVGDTIFFDLEEGSIGGPYRGAYGYYIARVNRRVPTEKKYSLSDANQRESIEQDYVQVRFVQFAAQAMAEAEIKGL